jgi:UrcA family protein
LKRWDQHGGRNPLTLERVAEKPTRRDMMSICPTPITIKRTAAILGASLSCLMLATPSRAQDNPTPTLHYRSSAEEVTVRPQQSRGSLGAPIVDVTMSQLVSFSDLDIPTVNANIELRHRVKSVAKRVCDRLEIRYPAAEPDRWTCYQRALEQVTPLVDTAIHTHPVANFPMSP